MKVSALCDSGYMDVRIKAESLSDSLYAQLFSYAIEKSQISNLNNALLVNLGLLKVRNIRILLNITYKKNIKTNKTNVSFLE